ncbi:MAG: type II toxin-antitoxin system VapC family toxin [Thermoprotei archaeon]|nr:type II toxin-antitoxin system VapC family toxin [Thermoprotei archaeon]
MNLVIDVSVFIDRLFIYDEERSNRARNVFRIVDKRGYNIFEPQVFGIELASQLIRRKPRNIAERVYYEVMERIIVVEEIGYDLLLDVAFQTSCRAIDTYYIATASIVDGILISADRVMATNARRYGVDAYYIHDVREYNELMSKLQ